jgi:hypothetical protein
MTTRAFQALSISLVFAAIVEAGHRGRNVSIHDGDQPKSCDDIEVEFDDRPALRSEERVTVPFAAGRSLRIEAATNSGVHVREQDRGDFEIVVCKAAPSQAGLADIALARSGDAVTVKGPAGDDWVGYLLVAAPRKAALEISASNGPIGLIGLSGRVVARTENGPISVQDSAGDLDLEAQNGPIDFHGAGGHSKLRTQNGPIGVSLSGSAWAGEGLEARAVNGPVSLAIPAGYRSGTLVESRGHSPFQCRGLACAGARKTWDDDHRRIELGDGPALVRLSTENGPVSVRTGTDALADED